MNPWYALSFWLGVCVLLYLGSGGDDGFGQA